MTPSAPEGQALRDALARSLEPHAFKVGSPDYYGPDIYVIAYSARQRVALKSADTLIAGPLAPLLADLATLRSNLAETTEAANDMWEQLCSAEIRAGAAEAERDALAEMAGEAMAESHQHAWVGAEHHRKYVALGVEAYDRAISDLATAETRTREAEARAERAEAALKPFAACWKPYLAAYNAEGCPGWSAMGTVRIADLKRAADHFPTLETTS